MAKIIKALQKGGLIFYMFVVTTFALSIAGVAMYVVIKVLKI